MTKKKIIFRSIELVAIVAYSLSIALLFSNFHFTYHMSSILAAILIIASLIYKKSLLAVIANLFLTLISAAGVYTGVAFSGILSDWSTTLLISLIVFACLTFLELLDLKTK